MNDIVIPIAIVASDLAVVGAGEDYILDRIFVHELQAHLLAVEGLPQGSQVAVVP
jgi:hypothetical protein